jgi:uncharacterized membrane protein YciS (DUF1049 family)
MIGTTVYELTSFEILVGWAVLFIIGFIAGIIAVIAFVYCVVKTEEHKLENEKPIPEPEVTPKRRRRRSQ